MGAIVPDAIEAYLADLNSATDPLLKEIAARGQERGLPLVDAEVGALLRVLATAVGARKALEIGTAVGYSGIWIAGALPHDGMLITLEMDGERAREARENFERAGLANRVSIMLGDAQRTVSKVSGPFDLIFQDGDKKLYEPMLDRLVSLLRPGGLLVTDNVLWDGKVAPGFAKAGADDENTRAIASYNRRLAAHPQLVTAIVPMRDGVSISVKNA
jgi:predicted O-methyltransferase YrrM